MAKAPAPAIERVSRISSGAYATLDSASLANTGRAIRLGSSVCCSLSERNGLPSSSRLAREVELATSAKRTGGQRGPYPAPPAVRRTRMARSHMSAPIREDATRARGDHGVWPARLHARREPREPWPLGRGHRPELGRVPPPGLGVRRHH